MRSSCRGPRVAEVTTILPRISLNLVHVIHRQPNNLWTWFKRAVFVDGGPSSGPASSSHVDAQIEYIRSFDRAPPNIGEANGKDGLGANVKIASRISSGNFSILDKVRFGTPSASLDGSANLVPFPKAELSRLRLSEGGFRTKGLSRLIPCRAPRTRIGVRSIAQEVEDTRGASGLHYSTARHEGVERGSYASTILDVEGKVSKSQSINSKHNRGVT